MEQSVARQAHNLKVRGSSPLPATNLLNFPLKNPRCGGLFFSELFPEIEGGILAHREGEEGRKEADAVFVNEEDDRHGRYGSEINLADLERQEVERRQRLAGDVMEVIPER